MSGQNTNFDEVNGFNEGAPMPDRRGWHIDKGLNPAYIVPLVASILAGLAWAGTINSGQDVQNQRLSTVEKKVDDVIIISREDMKEINRKLDRLIERSK